MSLPGPTRVEWPAMAESLSEGGDMYVPSLLCGEEILRRLNEVFELQQVTKQAVDHILSREVNFRGSSSQGDEPDQVRWSAVFTSEDSGPVETRPNRLLRAPSSRSVVEHCPKREFLSLEVLEESGQMTSDFYLHLVTRLGETYSTCSSGDNAGRTWRGSAYRRLQRLVMPPTSRRLMAVDILSASAFLVDMWAIPYVLAWDHSSTEILNVLLMVTALWWTASIGFTFLTGVYHQGELEMRPEIIAKIYVGGAFLRDALICLSDWTALVATLVLGENGIFVAAGKFPRTLRLLRLLRFSTMVRFDRCIQRVKDHCESAPYRVGAIHSETLSFSVPHRGPFYGHPLG